MPRILGARSGWHNPVERAVPSGGVASARRVSDLVRLAFLTCGWVSLRVDIMLKP